MNQLTHNVLFQFEEMYKKMLGGRVDESLLPPLGVNPFEIPDKHIVNDLFPVGAKDSSRKKTT